MGQEQSAEKKSTGTAVVSPVGEIVVVKSGKSNTEGQQINKDPDLVRLEKINSFFPLMKNSLSIPSMTDFDLINKPDVRPARMLCARYETHLRLCAEAVAFDQDAITHRLKEMDSHSASVLRGVCDRHKKLQSQMHLIETVEDVKRNIDRVEITLQQVVPLMDKLNNMLPEDKKMEPFLKSDD